VKILVTGAKGMLGRTLVPSLEKHEVLPVDIEEMDILEEIEINRVFSQFRPDAVVHCAAMTDVDGCEKSPHLAMAINGTASGNIAKASQEYGSRMIAISTDYVFNGNLERPYLELDPTAPETAYGRSKLAGERLIQQNCEDHLIMRIAWLYGQGGPSFVHTIGNLLNVQGEPLRVVNDQIGNPTSCADVAGAIIEYLQDRKLTGVVHNTCEGEATWFDLACQLKDLKGASRDIVPCTSEEFPRPAKRPANSRLENRVRKDLGFPDLKDWRLSLELFIKEYGHEC
jgi:dTDP-4-dehydrorhamnose reductase